MPRQTIATQFGDIGEGDLLFVEDWVTMLKRGQG